MLRRVIGEDIDLAITTTPDLEPIEADPGQLEQVILNLVVNARDAMPEGGRLTIETANVRIDEESSRPLPDCPPGDYVLLAVSDSGCGIDEQVKPHIFEPFFTTKGVGKGTGLGLSTIYGIVRQGGGHVRVESDPGEGARFLIYFPRAEGLPAPGAVPQRRTRSRGTETILLVEDEAAVRRMVTESERPIHLLLTDVVMPQLSGRELALRLTALRPDLKVMYMTGYADESMEQEGLLEPGAVLLKKPFTPDTLAGKIREALDGGPDPIERADSG